MDCGVEHFANWFGKTGYITYCILYGICTKHIQNITKYGANNWRKFKSHALYTNNNYHPQIKNCKIDLKVTEKKKFLSLWLFFLLSTLYALFSFFSLSLTSIESWSLLWSARQTAIKAAFIIMASQNSLHYYTHPTIQFKYKQSFTIRIVYKSILYAFDFTFLYIFSFTCSHSFIWFRGLCSCVCFSVFFFVVALV